MDLGQPVSEIQWYKDGKTLKEGNNYKMEYIDQDESATLTIKKTSLEDAGVYKVHVKNDLGEVTSEGSLTVHTKPTIKPDASSKPSTTQKAGTAYVVTAEITGVPTPAVTWLHNDLPIDSPSVSVDSTDSYSRLKWKDMPSNCSGTFTATATNEAGSASCSFTLNVISKPSPPQNLEVKDIKADSVAVAWTAPDSNGGSDVTSYIVERMDVKRGSWVTAGTTKAGQTELVIPKLTTGNEYLIRVFAENDVGASEPVTLDTPVVPKRPFTEPDSPTNLAVENVTATRCVVLWDRPVSDGGSPITGYTVERKSQYNARWTKVNKVPVTDLELEITDLVEGTDYEFRVIAENKAGAGPPCSPIGPITAQAPKGQYFFCILFNVVNQYHDRKHVFHIVPHAQILALGLIEAVFDCIGHHFVIKMMCAENIL